MSALDDAAAAGDALEGEVLPPAENDGILRMSGTEQLRATTRNRKHFSVHMPGLQTAWDSTSLGDFKTCPRKYFYSHILGLRSRREALPLTFGIYFHSGLEMFQRFRFAGMEYEDALNETVKGMLMDMGKHDVDPETGEKVPGTFKPWLSDDTRRTRQTCLRSVIWHCEQHREDILETMMLANGKPAVELSFRFEAPIAPAVTGEKVLLAGHLDRVVKFQSLGMFVLDHKTTTGSMDSRYFDRYSPDNQMSLYTIASKIVFELPARGVIIDGVGISVSFTQYQRGFVYRSEGQCEEWLDDLGMWQKQAEMMAEKQHWPMNDKSCSLYGGCTYQGVCKADPAVRHSHINMNFERRPWNPLESR